MTFKAFNKILCIVIPLPLKTFFNYFRFGPSVQSLQWQTVQRDYSADFENILPVTDLLLSLPPTSVSCETSFSQMKLIKTSRRARLQDKTLDVLMRVKLESPPIESFDPTDTVERWLVCIIYKYVI